MKNQKGITLIALIITILVMLILASVIIISLGNVNILDRSEDAVDKYSYAHEKERMQMAVLNAATMGGVNITNLTHAINDEFNEDWEFFRKTEEYCIVKVKSTQRKYEITVDGILEDYKEKEILAASDFFNIRNKIIVGLSQYGKETLASLAGQNVKLVIPEGIIGFQRFDNKQIIDNLKNLIIDAPNITTISESAFSGCQSLVSINAPNVIETGMSVFANCTNLTNAYLPKLNKVNISTFTKCINLINVDISGATEIQYGAFGENRNLVNVNISNVKIIGNLAFKDCSNLKTLQLPNVTTIGGSAFESCTKLVDVNIPNVTTIGGRAFGWCSNLTSVNSPNLKTVNASAFRDCVKLSNIDLSKVTEIPGEYTFYNCTSLTTIDLSSIQTIGNFAFYNCNNIETVNYADTMEEWKKVSKGTYNQVLSKAKIICTNGTIN